MGWPLEPLEQPSFVSFEVVRKHLPLRLRRCTIAMDDLAQDGFIHPDRLRQLILVAPATKNLQFKVRVHSLVVHSMLRMLGALTAARSV